MATRHKCGPSLRLDQIAGLNEALVEAKREQFKTREDGWLELTHDICGFKSRTMTVRDYILLERHQSPFLYRKEPRMSDLALFLWVLSPQFDRWCNRKHFIFLQHIHAFFYGKIVQWKFGRNIPESSEPAVVECFKYIDKMFFDCPASTRGSSESCLTYMAGWFDQLQSEYGTGEEQIWKMGLPRLFQSLQAITRRNNPSTPQFNQKTDRVKLYIMNGLRSGKFTMEQLREGKFDKDEFRTNLN